MHYLDVTASDDTVAAVERLEGDATALLSVGLAPGVTSLLARHCVELTGGRDVEIGMLLGGGERHGAAAVEWTLGGPADLGPSWRTGFPAPCFAVAVTAGGVTCAFTGRRQSRATGVVAALLVDRLPALPHGGM